MYNESTGVYFDIEIGQYNSFLEYHELYKFELIETAGIVPPVVEIVFATKSNKIRQLVIENNTVIIKIGSSEYNADSYIVSPAKIKTEFIAQGTHVCYIYGYLIKKTFLFDHLIKSIKGTSLEVLTALSAEYLFDLDTDITSVNETEQPWISTNQTMQHFMTDVWLHMNIYPSFPLMAITRNGSILLKDFNNIVKSEPKYIFTKVPSGYSNEIFFLNNFSPVNNTTTYNLYSGYGKTVSIMDQVEGTENSWVNENKNILSNSHEVEVSRAGNRSFNGKQKSDNVHDNYNEAYNYNCSKLLQLSNICGFVEFMGYNRDLNLLDLGEVKLSDSEIEHTREGRYIVNTTVLRFSSQIPFTTRVYLCRDTINNIEDSIISPDNGIQINSIDKSTILSNLKLIRQCMSVLRMYLNSTLISNIQDYVINLKYNLLNSFSIGEYAINLNSQQEAITSIQGAGYSLRNRILEAVIPIQYLNLFQTVGWGTNSSMLSLLSSLVSIYAPTEYASFYQELLITLDAVQVKLNSISVEADNKANNIDIEVGTGNTGMLETASITSFDRISDILNEMVDNTEGINLPVPNIELTESQTLYNDTQLRNYVADEIIDSLGDKGYLTGVDLTVFKSILLGETTLDYNLITLINSNKGLYLFTRFWGTYVDLEDLTNHTIRKSYKDKFYVVDCMRLIDCSNGRRVFFAIPSVFTNLSFYINSTEVTMSSFSIDVRYFDDSGANIPYTVYYSDTLYNSNSVICEVRR